MLRVLLLAGAINLAIGIVPASAQGGEGCGTWCRVNRCSGGMQEGSAPICMQRCIAACLRRSSGSR
jgi:hypothetical protein